MTTGKKRTLEEIQGTFIFDGKMSRVGFPLNSMSMALNNAEDRAAFRSDPEAFMERFAMSDEQKEAVRNRDWMRMLELGGNIYFTAKIGMVDGLSVQDINAQMTGVSTDAFKEMMRNGGRNPNG